MLRWDVEKMIFKGFVFVNGNMLFIGDKVSINDEIKVNGKIINLIKNIVFKYYLFNKFKNIIIILKDFKGCYIVIDLINISERIVFVGRLDCNIIGVLLFIIDYELVNKLIYFKYEIERVYCVRIDLFLILKEFKEFNVGIEIDGKMSY